MRRSPVTGSSEDRSGAGRRFMRLIHCNNTRGELPCSPDRHERTGMGFIGDDGFRRILCHITFASLPRVCKTPVDDCRYDRCNIAKVSELAR